MSEHPWWQTAVIYQVYPRSFMDSNTDGVGDLPGITSRLDYLTDTLGVDALWIAPFFPSPMADFGYDVADYTDVDPVFGTLDDFDRLVVAAHARGLRVIIDWVPNHTSDRHPWFVESRSSRTNPRRDWYVWRDPKPDGSPPNNWLSNFGGPAWTLDKASGQYYLHSFLKEQPDLNWRNPEVEQAMFATVRFWLDRGVDGIRIDVAHRILKDPELRDNPPAPSRREGVKELGDYDTQLHIHDMAHPDVHRVYRRLRRMLAEYPGERFAVGEIHDYDFRTWAAYYGANLDELHMPYNFTMLYASPDAATMRRLVDELEAAIPDGAWPNYVLGNHDEPRLATRMGADRARLLTMMLLTLRGTPTIYAGDELGLPELEIPDELQQDPWAHQVPGKGRDGCRTPMLWNDEPHAGFSSPETARLWLPIHDDYRSLNVETQRADPDSVLNLYRRVLTFRRSSPALQTGGYTPRDDVPADCFVYERRTDDGSEVIVVLNFAPEPRRVALAGHVAVSTHGNGMAGDVAALELHPFEGVILEP